MCPKQNERCNLFLKIDYFFKSGKYVYMLTPDKGFCLNFTIVFSLTTLVQPLLVHMKLNSCIYSLVSFFYIKIHTHKSSQLMVSTQKCYIKQCNNEGMIHKKKENIAKMCGFLTSNSVCRFIFLRSSLH